MFLVMAKDVGEWIGGDEGIKFVKKWEKMRDYITCESMQLLRECREGFLEKGFDGSVVVEDVLAKKLM